jgi:Ras-related protein Rab-23
MKQLNIINKKVGKTSMTQRYVKNLFTNEYKKTLGVDFLTRKKYIKTIDKTVEFMIWDTAGQEYYDAITKKYYRGANGALIVFSVGDRESFDNVDNWKEKVIGECGNIPIFLVMNKIDLLEGVVVSEKEATQKANSLQLKLYKVSVKDNIMVNDVFDNLAIDVFSKGNNFLIKFNF